MENAKPEVFRHGDNVENVVAKIVKTDFSADYVPMRKQSMDFSNTENPLGYAPHIDSEIKKNFAFISRYPARGHDTLIESLATHHKLPKKNFFVGNGATGCIQNVVMTFVRNGDHVILPELSFPLPIFAATAIGGGGLKVPMQDNFRIDFEAMLRSVNRNTALVFLCNPNNPTGLYEDLDAILGFVEKVKVPVLVSEANIEYAGQSLLESFSAWPNNLIVVKSFSKVHGLAGLRIGYGVARPELISEIMRFQLPFAVSGLSEAAAAAAVTSVEHVSHSVAAMRDEMDFLCQQFEDLGFFVLRSRSNMFLAKLPHQIPNTESFLAGLEEQGITILSGSAFSPSLERFVRISPRRRDLNMALIAATKKFLCTLRAYGSF
jgi:histidinol-phosphate aminotransferase